MVSQWFKRAYIMSENAEDQMTMENIEGFFKGVRAALDKYQGKMLKHFISTVKSAHYWPLADLNFLTMCKQNPVFGFKVFTKFFNDVMAGGFYPVPKDIFERLI